MVSNEMFLLLQRATLAEKEVSALKEQLATANQNLQLVESKGGGGNKPPGGGGGDMEQNTMDIISRSGLEVELAAKEKEVSSNVPVAVSAASGCVSANIPQRPARNVLSIRYDVIGPQLLHIPGRGGGSWFALVRRKPPTYAV